LMLGALGSAAVAWRTGRARWLVGFTMIGFAAGGALLASDAWQRAHESTLRRAFDEIARIERAEAEAGGRLPPADPSAFVLVEGRLRADASPGPSGVSRISSPTASSRWPSWRRSGRSKAGSS